MKKAILGSLFLFLFFPLAYAQLTLNPSKFSVEIVGGENISKNFTIEWNGKTPVVCYLSYEITQANGVYNGKELWLNFSDNPTILEPYKPKTIEFYIHSLPNIQPDNYTITIKAEVNLEQVEKEVERVKYKRTVIIYENKTKIAEMNDTINSLNETIENLNQELSSAYEKYNETLEELESLGLNLTNFKELINLLNQTLYEKEQEIENLKNEIGKARDVNFVLGFIGGLISVGITTLAYLKFRKK